MGIITLLISLVFSCNFISSTVTTNYLASHPTTLQSINTRSLRPQKFNPIFTFNDSYISSFHEQTTPAMLSVKINTNNLNLNNKIYWANQDGGVMGGMVPLKWTYQFDTNIPASSTTYQFSFNHLGYNSNWKQLNLQQVLNINEATSFVNNFFNNATIKMPYKMLIACTPYSDITNYFTLKGPYYTHQPNGLTFSKFITYKLFQAPSFNDLWRWGQVDLPITKNNLFLDLNLSNCQDSYDCTLNGIGQLDRYMVCLGNNLNYNYSAHYSHDVSTNIDLKITDLLPNLYYFNPQLLFQINPPSVLASNGWAYTTFPTLQISVNQSLLSCFYGANLIAQLATIINNYATNTNNQTLLKLNQELWNDKLWSRKLATNIFSLFDNKQTYNHTTNTLALTLNKNVDSQSLMNYLQMALNNKVPARWEQFIDYQAHDKLLTLTPVNCINLYQTLLRTYQNCKIQYTFLTNNSSVNYSLSYPNLMISLNANNCSKYVLPYDYYYDVFSATYTLNNCNINWIINDQFDIVKYPQVITNYVVNNQTEPINPSNQVKIIPLTLFSSLPSLTLFNLEDKYKLTSNQLTTIINEFNNNYNSSVNTFNNYLNNQVTLSLIKLAIYHSFYSLFSSKNIIDYCNQYGFDNNLLANNNSSLFSDFAISPVDSKLGIYQVQFAINNEFDFEQLLADDYLQVQGVITLVNYQSIVNGYFYLANDILHPTPKPVKKVIVVPKPTPINPPVKVVPKPVPKLPPKPVPKIIKKKVITPLPIKKPVIHISKPVVKPTPIIPKVTKPIIINRNQTVNIAKEEAIQPWGYFLIVLPLILLILGFAGFFTYLKVKALIHRKKQKQ